MPGRHSLLGEPYRQAAAPDQRGIIFRPVRHPVSGCWDLVAAALVELVRHGFAQPRAWDGQLSYGLGAIPATCPGRRCDRSARGNNPAIQPAVYRCTNALFKGNSQERTDFSQSIDIDGETTAIGIIARLEHVLDRMEAEIEEQRRRVADAKARLAGFEPRLGEIFPLQGELDAKLAQLAEIEADLASTEGIVNGDRSILASV
jgi:hypothetical protein